MTACTKLDIGIPISNERSSEVAEIDPPRLLAVAKVTPEEELGISSPTSDA